MILRRSMFYLIVHRIMNVGRDCSDIFELKVIGKLIFIYNIVGCSLGMKYKVALVFVGILYLR